MIDTTNRNSALASALVDELARCGSRQAFASPGSRSSPVTLALDREESIELTPLVDERVSGFAAMGASLGSGSPAIVACTSGSAAANLHPAIVEADEAGVPLIVLTSDRPPELRGIGAGQTIDQIGLYGRAARWFCEVGTHEADDAGLMHMRATACRAFGEALGGRGPVHLNLSWRDPLGPQSAPQDLTASEPLAVEGRSGGRPLTIPLAGRAPDDRLSAAIAKAVGAADRGLIVAGRLPEDRLSQAIGELSLRSGFPVLAEPTSQFRFGAHDRSGLIAAYDLIARTQPSHLAPDLVLRFGDMPTSKPLRTWLAQIDADQIVVDPPGAWNEPTRRAGAVVRADPASVIAGILQRIGPADSGWRKLWMVAESRAQAAVDGVLSTGAEPLSEPSIQRLLGEVYDDDERVMLASSMPIRDAEAFLRGGDRQVRFHSNRGANGIDGTISTGAGITLGTGQRTWIVLGDLATLHDIGGLAAAVDVRPQPRIVVIDNGGGGIFDFLPQAEQVESGRFARLFTTPSKVDLESAAGAFGVPYVPVVTAEDLLGLREHDGVLAHLRPDRAANVRIHRELAAAVASAIDA